MPIILGIDPGSLRTGYGFIEAKGTQLRCLACGTIRTKTENWGARLESIFDGLSVLIEKYSPDLAAIEEVFFHHNAQSALKLGYARGAAILALAKAKIPMGEYSPREVKLSVAGYGAAEKTQIQQMVRYILALTKTPEVDAADALAIAICHFQHQGRLAKLREKI